LFSFARNFLSENGKFTLLYPSAKDLIILETAYLYGFFPLKHFLFRNDSSKDYKRSIWNFGHQRQGDFIREKITLFEPDGRPTEKYKDLTREFYPGF
jgi:tRNA1(Val) A37 N6-methylase TrmN6